jgi:hypothetical protein
VENDMNPNQTKRGRRLKPESKAKRAVFSARITEETKAALLAEAERTGRSIADVAELWLEQARTKKETVFADTGQFSELAQFLVEALTRTAKVYPEGLEHDSLDGMAAEQIVTDVAKIWYSRFERKRTQREASSNVKEVFRPELAALGANLELARLPFSGICYQPIRDGCITSRETDTEIVHKLKTIATKMPLEAWGDDLFAFSPYLELIPLEIVHKVISKANVKLPPEYFAYMDALLKFEEAAIDLEEADTLVYHDEFAELDKWSQDQANLIVHQMTVRPK